MKVNREKLLSTLKAVSPALMKKEVIEQATFFAFLDGRVLTFNDMISISHPIEPGLEGAVKAEEFFGLLSRLKDEEIELETRENELLIGGKRSKAGIRLEAKISLPIDEVRLPTKWRKLPDNFMQALSFCCLSVGKDMAKALLTCIHGSEGTMESCDNFCLTNFSLSSPLKGQLLLPAKAAKILQDYSPTEYSIQESWIHFRNREDVAFSARMFEGEYPDLGSFFDMGKEVHEVTLPSGLGETLDRAGIFSSTELMQESRVTVSLSKRTLSVRGEGPNGWFEESSPVRWSGEKEAKFDIYPELLKQILPHAERIRIDFEKGKIRIDGDSFIHAIALLAP